MTRKINSTGATYEHRRHVLDHHRGQAVPSGDWTANPGPVTARNTLGNRKDKIRRASKLGNSSLPYDPLSTYLTTGNEVRIRQRHHLPKTEQEIR
jgi:hypothetical protein